MTFTSALITGASSGLGAALARVLARPGTLLHLSGRNGARLEAVAATCRDRGAEVAITVLDVTHTQELRAWIIASEARRPLNLVIANAGISGGTHGGPEGVEQIRAIWDVNVTAAMETVQAALPFLTARRKGQVGIMSSLASFRGFPGAPAYCASKAAVRVWGEGLRGDMRPHGVGISVICPGFVETPMTAVNGFRMPFLMKPEQAAAIMADGLAANRGRIAFPWPTHWAARLAGCLPDSVMDGLGRLLPRKG